MNEMSIYSSYSSFQYVVNLILKNGSKSHDCESLLHYL